MSQGSGSSTRPSSRKTVPPNKWMQLTKLRAAPVPQAQVPPCAPVGRTDGGTVSQLIRGVGPTRGRARAGGGPVRMRRAILFFAVVVFSTVQLSADGGADLQGARVRLETAGSTRLVGFVVDADAASLMIQSRPRGAITRVPRADVLGLEVSRGFRRHTVQGLVGGALAWAAVVGLYAAFDTLDESGVGEPLFVGGMVAAGGLVGTLIKTERWERVPTSAVSLRMSPRRRGVQAEVVLTF